ncbi:hypothetical protein [Undibacterium griseum]|uniref:Uncharacterized protein n=1 Tax=Undibacterium griseum TaxID=2762295 RepID=A0ABR6YM85_9BURK|nr:hypothetical protein [Undibacterium griseum]MBC3884969.1 hypothetical protein [Undibacterium griseum]
MLEKDGMTTPSSLDRFVFFICSTERHANQTYFSGGRLALPPTYRDCFWILFDVFEGKTDGNKLSGGCGANYRRKR